MGLGTTRSFSVEDLLKVCVGATDNPLEDPCVGNDAEFKHRLQAGVQKLFGDLQAETMKGFADDTASGATVSTEAASVGEDATFPPAVKTSQVPRHRVLTALGSVAPCEGFRAWSTRMLLLSQDAMHGLAFLLGPESSGKGGLVTKADFCEAVVLLNGNIHEAADWFEHMEGSLSSPSCPKSCTGTLNYGMLQRRVLGRPRLEGAWDASEPLTLEEVVIRLLAVWGDVSAAFGLINDVAVASAPKTPKRAHSPRETPWARQSLSQVSVQSTCYRGQRKACRPSKQEWHRALRGKLGRHFLEEREARAEAERLASVSEPLERLFPNVCDRLLVPKSTWLPLELITVRYMLTDQGFWGPGGPPPLETCNSASRRLALGARPFIAIMLSEGPTNEQEVHCRAAVDPRAKSATTFLRAPKARVQEGEQGPAASTSWVLRLFASDDGLTPLHPLSAPLAIRVVLERLAPPANIKSVDQSHDSVTLEWPTTVCDGGSPIEHYEVCVWEWEVGVTGPDAEPVAWRGKTSMLTQQVAPLKPDCAYLARVRCVNRVGAGKWSANSRKLHTGPATPSVVPAPVVAHVGSTDVLLQWALDETSLVTHYSVQILPGTLPQNSSESSGRPNASMRVLDGAATEALIGGLLAFASYCFKVRAHNASGAGPWSKASQTVCTNNGPPQAPEPPDVLEVAQDGINVTWEAPNNSGGSEVTGYMVKAQSIGPKVVQSVEVVVTSSPAWIYGLAGNTWYTLHVAAKNIAGFGTLSLPSRPTRTAPVAPQPPVHVRTIDANADCPVVGWNIPEEDGGTPIVSYKVKATPAAPLLQVEVLVVSSPQGSCAAATIVTLPPLRAVTEYSVVVYAESAAGISAPSKPLVLRTSCTVPAQPPAAPSLAGEVGQTAIPLRWEPVLPDGGSPVMRYEVLVATPEGNGSGAGQLRTGSAACAGKRLGLQHQRSVCTESCEALVDGLEPNRTYHFALRAQNAEGWSQRSRWSGPFRTVPSVPGLPSQPRQLRVTSRSVVIEWDPPESDAPLLEYETWSGLSAQGNHAATLAAPRGGRRNRTMRTSASVTGLTPMTSYVFRVRARNRTGWSQWSPASDTCSTSDVCSREEIKTTILLRYGGTVASVFRAFDRDGDGSIDREEFLAGFVEAGLGKTVSLEQCVRLFADADERGCGRLTYRDFAKSFSPYKATPALTRQPALEIPESQREELLDQIGHGRQSISPHRDTRLGRIVERLTTSRTRLQRSSSEMSFDHRTAYSPGPSRGCSRVPSPPHSPTMSRCSSMAVLGQGGRHSTIRMEIRRSRSAEGHQ